MKYLWLASLSAVTILLGPAASAADLRIGIIGCDTSHVPAFTKAFNDPKATGDLAGFRVVAAFPGVTATTRPTDARALARFELQGLQTSLRAAAPKAADRMTRAHFVDLQARIDRVLRPPQ